jgi:hypothetical protein
MIRKNNFSYEILDHIAVLESNGKVSIELNKIAYNGGEPKWDIRAWRKDDDGDKKMLKGITLSDGGLRTLAEILSGYLEGLG